MPSKSPAQVVPALVAALAELLAFHEADEAIGISALELAGYVVDALEALEKVTRRAAGVVSAMRNSPPYEIWESTDYCRSWRLVDTLGTLQGRAELGAGELRLAGAPAHQSADK